MKFIRAFNLLLLVLFSALLLTTGCVRIHVHTDLSPSNLQCTDCPSLSDEQNPGPVPNSRPSNTKISLKIKKHELVELTENEAITILEHATRVANTEDQCNLKLVRDGGGDIEKFTWPQEGDTPGVISSQFDFDIVTGLPGVKVVQDVQWCGRPGPFMGCADLPGESLAVEMYREEIGDGQLGRPFYETLGVLWLHEVGHNKNNFHRLSPPGVMHPQIFQDHKELSSTECARYQQP